jgi:hypothetical protein
MLLAPIVEGLEDDLKRAAAVGGEETRRAAAVLAEALGSSVRLRFMDALQQAAEELAGSLPGLEVEVHLRGRDPVLTVTAPGSAGHNGGAEAGGDGEPGDDFGFGGEAEMARITLRIPERLKAQIERAAQRQGISVNSWLVDAAAAGLRLPTAGRRGPRRVTGFVRG